MIYISQCQFMHGISLMIMKYVKSILDQCQIFELPNFLLKLNHSIYVLELMKSVSVSHICYMLFLKKLQRNVDKQNRKYLRGLQTDFYW